MTGRPKTWTGYEEEEFHKVALRWPKSLWRKLQSLALEEETSATALLIEATEKLLESRRKEGKGKKK